LEGPVSFVANETIPAMNQRMQTEHFSEIHAALFKAAAQRLRETIFFPEVLVAVEPRSDASVVLSRQNRFQVPKYYRRLNVYPRALIIEGRLTGLSRLGRDFAGLVPPQARRFLPGAGSAGGVRRRPDARQAQCFISSSDTLRSPACARRRKDSLVPCRTRDMSHRRRN
jgi:hypothetical protein